MSKNINLDIKKKSKSQEMSKGKKWLLCGMSVSAAAVGIGVGVGVPIVLNNQANRAVLQTNNNVLSKKGDTCKVVAENFKKDSNLKFNIYFDSPLTQTDLKKMLSITQSKDNITVSLLQEQKNITDPISLEIECNDQNNKQQATSHIQIINPEWNKIPTSWKLKESGKIQANKYGLNFNLSPIQSATSSGSIDDGFYGTIAPGETVDYEVFVDQNNIEHLVVSGISNVAYQDEAVYFHQEVKSFSPNNGSLDPSDVIEYNHNFNDFKRETARIISFEPSQSQNEELGHYH